MNHRSGRTTTLILKNTSLMITFKTGKFYSHNWITNSDLISYYKIVKRTAKRITAVQVDKFGNVQGKEVLITKGIQNWDGVESCKIQGNYSMCPILRASKEFTPELPQSVIDGPVVVLEAEKNPILFAIPQMRVVHNATLNN